MSNMKNSKKNQQNELLPSRKPRLAKFILAAVILHVVVAVFILQIYKKKPEEQEGVKVKPEKTISKPITEKVKHASPAERVTSFPAQSRPMASSKAVLPDAAASSGSPVPLQNRQPKPLPHAELETTPSLLHSVDQIQATAQSTATYLSQSLPMAPSRTAGPDAVASSISPPRLPVHQADPLPAAPRENTQSLKPADEQIGTAADFNHQRTQAADARLALPKADLRRLPTRAPPMKTSTPEVQAIARKAGLASQMHSEPQAAEGPGKAAQRDAKIAAQPADLSSPKPVKIISASLLKDDLLGRIKKPEGVEDHIDKLVTSLILTYGETYSDADIHVQAKNLTFQDKGLESEGSKYFSGLVRAGIEKLDRVTLLAPADVSKKPDIVIEGEIWDDPAEVTVRLRMTEHASNRKLDEAALTINRQQLPKKMVLAPPEGKSLDVIQSVVELMQQLFPKRGDFQLGVWTDKGMDAVYVDGETLMVYILPETDAYLQVDYYQVDGKVVHLLPNMWENNFVKAGKPYIIGKSKSGQYVFVVGPPFGQELLVVLASQTPIQVTTQKIIEPAKPYIKRLARSIQDQKTKTAMAATHYIILTKARESKN
jgi:hypothetical protein